MTCALVMRADCTNTLYGKGAVDDGHVHRPPDDGDDLVHRRGDGRDTVDGEYKYDELNRIHGSAISVYSSTLPPVMRGERVDRRCGDGRERGSRGWSERERE